TGSEADEPDWLEQVPKLPNLASGGRFGARRALLRPCVVAGYRSKRSVKFTASRSTSFSPGNEISIVTASTVCAPRDIRSIATPLSTSRPQAKRSCETGGVRPSHAGVILDLSRR